MRQWGQISSQKHCEQTRWVRGGHVTSPHTLFAGLIVGADVVQLSLRDHTHIDVAAGAEVVEDACSYGISHQFFGLSLLSGQHIRVKHNLDL